MVDLCHDIKRAFPHLADTLIEYFFEETNTNLRLLTKPLAEQFLQGNVLYKAHLLNSKTYVYVYNVNDWTLS